MKKQPAVRISVPEPCGQDWDGMQPVADGRHCGLCRKTVVDFSRMTDAQLLAYFRSNQPVPCGQFSEAQLDRTIRPVTVPRSKIGTAIAASLLLLAGTSRQASGQTKKDSVRIEYQYSDKQGEPELRSLKPHQPGHSEYYGIVKDEKGNAVVNAIVELSANGSMKERTLTDFDGVYKLSYPYNPSLSCYSLRIRYIGRELTIVNVPNRDVPVRVDGRLKDQSDFNAHSIRVVAGGPRVLIDLAADEGQDHVKKVSPTFWRRLQFWRRHP